MIVADESHAMVGYLYTSTIIILDDNGDFSGELCHCNSRC
jgi:hypothetical protein